MKEIRKDRSDISPDSTAYESKPCEVPCLYPRGRILESVDVDCSTQNVDRDNEVGISQRSTGEIDFKHLLHELCINAPKILLQQL